MNPKVNKTSLTPAVFLDRDGVLVEDVDLLTKPSQIHIFDGVAEGLKRLRMGGYLLIVISNQPVVARGLIDEDEVIALQNEVQRRLNREDDITLDAFYFCPHHPNATLPAYRLDCDCRKPKPGLFLRAAQEHNIDMANSYMIGDRITDIIAGSRAGCRTILVQTGKHLDPPIQTRDPLDNTIQPGFICRDLPAAARWILESV